MSLLVKALKHGFKTRRSFVPLQKSFFTKSVNYPEEKLFLTFCKEMEKIESTSQRKLKIELFTNYLSTNLEDTELLGSIVKLAIPQLTTLKALDLEDKIRLQYNFDSMIRAYLVSNLGISIQEINQFHIKYGDISKLFQQKFNSLLPPTTIAKNEKMKLTISDVLASKEKILSLSGLNSSEMKLSEFSTIISKAHRDIEAQYLSRIFLNKLNIGIAEKGALMAIKNLKSSQHSQIQRNKAQEFIEYAEKEIFKYNINSSETTTKSGDLIELCMCRTGDTMTNVLELISKRCTQVLAEVKYDGERSQIHFDRKTGLLKFASRSFQDQTSLYNKLHDILKKQITTETSLNNFILDGEITCFSKSKRKFVNFQELRRINEEDDEDKEYYFVAFDVIMINDRQTHQLNIEERKIVLHENLDSKLDNVLIELGEIVKINEEGNESNIVKEDDEVKPAKSKSVTKISESVIQTLEKLYNEAKLINCEGLVLKEVGKDTKYAFGKRTWHKLKYVKPEGGMTDTVDLIPIAGYFGKGSKNSSVFNAFLMAVYHKQTNQFVSLCKLGTGFSQEQLKQITERLMKTKYEFESLPSNYIFPSSVKPSIFLRPTEVWEVGYDTITLSKNYTIGMGELASDPNCGLSLRFPRFYRTREDKTINEADTDLKIMHIYKKANNIL